MKNELQTNEYVNTTARIKATLPSSPRQFSSIGKTFTVGKTGLVIFETRKEARERRAERY